MIKITAEQLKEISHSRNTRFERELWQWLEENGSYWLERDETERRLIYTEAIELACRREQKTERFISQMTLALDEADDWKTFVSSDDLIAGRVHPNINNQSFAYQLPRRANEFSKTRKGRTDA